jgi:hypothetical protein
MTIYLNLRQLPELQNRSDEDIRAMRRQGVLQPLYMGRALMVLFLIFINGVVIEISWIGGHKFQVLPILICFILSVVVYLIFNHREFMRCRKKIREYFEDEKRER